MTSDGLQTLAVSHMHAAYLEREGDYALHYQHPRPQSCFPLRVHGFDQEVVFGLVICPLPLPSLVILLFLLSSFSICAGLHAVLQNTSRTARVAVPIVAQH